MPVAELAGLSLIAAGAVMLRLFALGHQSFWYDESVTVWIVRQTELGSVLHSVAHSESTPPLYYILAWIWGKAFGLSEVAARSLSAVTGIGVVPVVWAAGRRLVGPWAALVAAALVAVNPMLVWYSQEARAYSLLVLLSALSFLFFVRLRQSPTRGNAAGWAVASALALLTHYFAVFIVAGELAWLLVELTAFRRLISLASVPVILVGLALVPLAYHQEKDGRTAWIAAESLSARVGQVFHELSTANVGRISASDNLPHGGLGLIALGLVAVALALTCLAATRKARAGAAVAAMIGGGSLVVPLVCALLGLDFFLDRNLVAAWIPLTLVPAAGLAARRTLPIGLATAAAICALGVAVDVQVTQDSDLQRQNWRALIHDLGPANNTRALVVVPAYYITPLQVYGQRLPPARPGDRIREMDVVGSTPKIPWLQSPPRNLRLTRKLSLNGGLRLERYTATGLFTLTPTVLRSLPGAVIVQAGRELRRWLGAAIPQVRRWQHVAGLIRSRRAQPVPTALLRVTASPKALLTVPPEIPRMVRVRQTMRRMLAAAAVLRSAKASQGDTAAAFVRSLDSLLAAIG